MQTHPTDPARLSRRLTIAIALLIALTLVPGSTKPAAAQLSGSIAFDDQVQQATGDGFKASFPWIAVDRDNNSHIVFANNDTSEIQYINNIGGRWSSPTQVQRNNTSPPRDPYIALQVDGSNRLHVVYSTGGAIFYRRGAISGGTVNWETRQQISENAKSLNPDLAVDGAGNAYVVWIDNRCGSIYNVFYRVRFADGRLSGVSAPKNDCKFQNRPQVVVTNDGKAHVVFQREKDIWYARLESNGWVSQDISNDDSTNSSNPSIGTDGTNLYAAWGEGIVTGNHDIRFTRSTTGGQSWSSRVGIADNSNFSQFPSVTYSATSGRVYVVWADNTDASNSRENEIWFREFDPGTPAFGAADRITQRGGDSSVPVISAGPGRIGITWQDKAGSDSEYSVFFEGGRIIGSGQPPPPPSACSGTLSLEGGAASTNKTTIAGQITPSNCAPTQMQVTVDNPPTDSSPKITYNPNFTVELPASTACSRTVYVRLFAGTTAGAAFSDSINVDTGIQASARAMNPHLLGLPAIYSSIGLLDSRDQFGASDGDPNFTRDRNFMLMVSDTGDCSKLKDVRVGDGPVIPIPASGTLALATALPGNPTPGLKEFTITVTDNAGNSQPFPQKLVYDPGPIGLNDNPVTLPVLANGGILSDATQGNSIVRLLSFTEISVNDNLYGKVTGVGPQLPNGSQFWGVWIANSRERVGNPVQDDTPQASGLKWYPVKVGSPGAAFTVPWSLFAGLGYNPTDAAKSGDYYVYVRFLDGAGNPSRGFLELKVTLPEGYSTPTVRMATVAR